ncbi:MAG: pseudouridine synthase [Gemmatimonadetes bacterium]|nr:pseudouridine synthase [Gemmatimonadota bacterium]
MAEEIRLQKYLSRAGAASRREAERLMDAGRVSVNGRVASELGTRVVPGVDVVALDGVNVVFGEIRWIAFHKPVGVLTTRSDPHGDRTVYDVLPEEFAELKYVGRLDRPTEGLLLMTNDGDAAHGLQHPSREVEREYQVTVAGEMSDDVIWILRKGVELEDGLARPKLIKLVDRGPLQTILRLVMTEGRKREVRRMILTVGFGVQRLVRLRFGRVTLGALSAGEWRDLAPHEVQSLMGLTDRK